MSPVVRIAVRLCMGLLPWTSAGGAGRHPPTRDKYKIRSRTAPRTSSVASSLDRERGGRRSSAVRVLLADHLGHGHGQGRLAERLHDLRLLGVGVADAVDD